MSAGGESSSEGRRRRGPSFVVEARTLALGDGPVAGIDEAGRGPLAGPVVAAAVVLDPRSLPDGVDDSKKLDEKARDRLLAAILESGAKIGIGIADVARIDAMNILRATMWAMSEAVARLEVAPRLVLVDGNRLPVLPCRGQAIVGGDARCLSIAAASIVAKVTRDRIMLDLARAVPGYGFERHKGYGTPEHLSALAKLGPTPHHRMSFKPVRVAFEAGQQAAGPVRTEPVPTDPLGSDDVRRR